MSDNVLVIVTDDQRYDELRYMPNARRFLSAFGTTFDWTHCNVPLCSPARTGILSGQSSRYHGVEDDTNNPSSTIYNNSAFVAMHNAGYRVGCVGKFLTGLSALAVKPGFDYWRAITGDGGSGYGIYEPYTYTVFTGSATVSPGIYQDHYLAGQAIDFIRGTEPWCLWYCPTSPHWPFNAPPNHLGEWAYRSYPTLDETVVTDKPSWIQALPAIDATAWAELQSDQVLRLRELLAVDDAIGAFVGTIGATGLSGRTTIMFVSDNGNMLGEHRVIGAAGARAGTKNTPYEPSLRVPMIAVGPGFPHKTVAVPTIQQDITATMLDIANASPLLGNQAGISLLDVAATPATYTSRATLHRRVNTAGTGSPDTIPDADGVVTSQYKLWRYSGKTGTDQYELYDLAGDPGELVNQANAGGSWLTIRNSLEATLNSLLAQAPGVQRTALPIDDWLTTTDAGGGPLLSLVSRLIGGADRVVPVGRRSVAITVRAAAGDTSPTLTTAAGTAVLPEAVTIAFSSDFPADELEAMTIATAPGDDVLVVETYLA